MVVRRNQSQTANAARRPKLQTPQGQRDPQPSRQTLGTEFHGSHAGSTAHRTRADLDHVAPQPTSALGDCRGEGVGGPFVGRRLFRLPESDGPWFWRLSLDFRPLWAACRYRGTPDLAWWASHQGDVGSAGAWGGGPMDEGTNGVTVGY